MFRGEIILTKDHALDIAATLAELAGEACRLGTVRADLIADAHALGELIEHLLSADAPDLEA